jgi:hypothetical protein
LIQEVRGGMKCPRDKKFRDEGIHYLAEEGGVEGAVGWVEVQ